MPARLLPLQAVHPDNMPVILPSRLLRRAGDEDLAAHYDRVQGGSYREGRARAQVLHEMQRRDDEVKARGNRAAVRYSRQLEQADAVEASYIAAENATRGNMLNRKGRAHDINPRALITGTDRPGTRHSRTR